jgi:TPP-dependent pyruvate/acetoin dehydrogenase alpha subunit
MAIADIAQRGAAHGVRSSIVDGNDVQAVYEATKTAVDRARNGGGPSLIECKTMRMLGHAIHDGAEYVPTALLDEWKRRDPVAAAERVLRERRIADDETLGLIESRCLSVVSDAVDFAENSDWPDPETVDDGVFAP